MNLGISRKLWVAWALLVGATAVSWFVGGADGNSEQLFLHPMITVGVVLIAAVKIWVIMQYFMELEHAPKKWRHMPGIWLMVLLLLMGVIYFGPFALTV